MKMIILFASIAIANGLLLTNIYNSLVDTKAWGSDIPNSIATAREYYKAANPANFYRLFSPVNQVLALLALLLFWRTSPAIRLSLGIALVLFVAADTLTFAYFYPRNGILFKTAQLTDVDTLKKTWWEWSVMNWIRSLIVLGGVFFSCLSLHRIYMQR